MQKSLIFTEIFNCAKIGAIAIESFHKHHDLFLTVFGTSEDFSELERVNPAAFFNRNTVPISIDSDELIQKFKTGHEGTARVFALAFSGAFSGHDQVIHFDSDIFFKRESISLIEDAFNEGYDIVGSRRCYKYNPSNVSGLDDIPDTVSTYFYGMKRSSIPKYEFEYLCKMFQGAIHPLGWLILDFGDPVVHAAMHNGAKVKFLKQNEIGSQNEFGKKNSWYKSNMNLDVGSHLVHFGGVGSGYSFFNGRSAPVDTYAQWSLGRWKLFAKLFYNEDVSYSEPTVYGSDGRWIFGSHDDEILTELEKDLKS
jgi:hypothetical protein